MSNKEDNLNTNAVDLFTPANRFVSASKIYGRLHRWWLLLRKYSWLLALIWLGILAPMYLYTAFTGPVFESDARMWVAGKINVSEDWGYTEQLVNFLGTQAALLRSPAIQLRALARLRAESKPASKPTGAGGPSSLNPAPVDSDVASAESASAPIPFDVKVEEGGKSSTLKLQAAGRDPAATRKFLDCLMQAYVDFKKETVNKSSSEAATSLNAEAAELKHELELAQAKLQTFEASNDVVFLQHQGSSAESYLASLNRQLAVLRTERRLLDSLKPEQWAATDAVQGNAALSPASTEEAAAKQLLASLAESQTTLFQADQKMHLLMAKRDELSRFLRPAHPKILELNREIADQEELVKVSRDEASNQMTLRRQALGVQIRNLEAASKEWNAKAIVASRKMADYDQINQKVQRLQAAYDKTLGLIQNIDVTKRVQQEAVGILDPASVAKPTHRMLIHMAMAIALSLTFSFGAMYCAALLRDDFASPAELAEWLSMPVLGQIPLISMKTSAVPLGIRELEHQRFEFLEAFRNLRASLLFMNNGKPNPKVIAITSSVPEEGKSTVALYLAATLAKASSRVLLVDADMRRPGLHKYFGLPSGPGLAELLDEEISPADAIFSTGVEHLELLRAGDAKRNPGELVLSPVWAQFLMEARSRFDYVLVDTPPVAATDDGATLALKTDGVLFIVRALSTSARVARGALDLLRRRPTRMLGLVFNRAVSSPCERQYYQPYARDYHWHPEKAERTQLADAGQTHKERAVGAVE